ncbi:hypothetical protein PUNSTDRAFT_130763 [Punctularia strigosozonata HHB-11173 SS5]|uniref:uncharacterized protein n=1 Tax=Punctularia strigosozonata (strain HHB-11173) TaxID=741275 RepID=UPI0004416FC5|nr:uncharacterized protein PUNSTDRAFT_130763 [Punctularia strigosozonata HHB-11173 SS5]EIN12503.1 hypothetical protein PUNSTDRAFT_130763 [Punctularia strigosozonata HHB-11173 SS5]
MAPPHLPSPQSTSIYHPLIHAQTSQAQRGQGALPVREMSYAIGTSGARVSVIPANPTALLAASQSPLALGYTEAHKRMNMHLDKWSGRAAGRRSSETFDAKLFMAKFTKGLKFQLFEDVATAVTGIDAHIGVQALHERTFYTLLPLFKEWSFDFDLKIEDTTLHLKKPVAALVANPTSDNDAVYHLLLTEKGAGSKATPRFKYGTELDIFCVIKRNKLEECDTHRINRHLALEDTEAFGFAASSQQVASPSKPLKRKNDTLFLSGSESENDKTDTLPSPHRKTKNSSTGKGKARASPKKPIPVQYSTKTGQGRKDISDTTQSLSNDLNNTKLVLPSTPPSNKSAVVFVSPSRYKEHLNAALEAQHKPAKERLQEAITEAKKFPLVSFYIPPQRTIEEIIKDAINDPLLSTSLTTSNLMRRCEVITVALEVNLVKSLGDGSFKTAHLGRVLSVISGDTLIKELTGDICVKQFFWGANGGAVRKRYRGLSELSMVYLELICVEWASALLDMVYMFMKREDSKNDIGIPPFDVPQMAFVKAALAICHLGKEEKILIIEQMIPQSVDGENFFLYIHNGSAIPTMFDDPGLIERAEFLAFAQHVQWLKTEGEVFISDLQGGRTLLTDPQIMTNP